MATRWYCNSTAPGFTPTNIRGTWNNTAPMADRSLKATKGATQQLSGTVAEATLTSPFDTLLVRWVSDALSGNGVVKGTLDFCMMARENNADADFATKVHVYVTVGDSDTVRGTLLANWAEPLIGGEWTNALTVVPVGKAAVAPVAVTPVAVQAGDRIVVEMGFRSYNVHATSRTAQIQYSSSPSATDAVNGSPQGAAPWFDIPDATRASRGQSVRLF